MSNRTDKFKNNSGHPVFKEPSKSAGFDKALAENEAATKARNAKTAKLRGLRLAKEQAERLPDIKKT